MKRISILLLSSCLIGLLFSCSSTRHLKEGEMLLRKNVIKVDDGSIDLDELAAIIKQRPNRYWGFYPFNLKVYYIIGDERVKRKHQKRLEKLEVRNTKRAQKGKKAKNYRRSVWEWLREVIGEPPVILDEDLVEKSRQQLHLYLKNKGYFNNTVSDTIRGKRKAKVHYVIQAGRPYTIRRKQFNSDTSLTGPMIESSKKTLIRPGINYDVDVLQQERKRIEDVMKNQGYFLFSKEYVVFEVDSGLNKHRVDMNIIVKNPVYRRQLPNGQDTLVEEQHEPYYINQIYINTNYNPILSDPSLVDTLIKGDFIFIQQGQLKFRPEVIMRAIYINPGELYNLDDHLYTNRRLAALKTFKFINIRFNDVSVQGRKMIDCEINLTPSPRQAITMEADGTHRSGNLGVSGNFVYNNKNSFKGAETLEFKLKGGLEAQQVSADVESTEGTSTGTAENVVENLTPFNTIEFGGEISLKIPELTGYRWLRKKPRILFSECCQSTPRYSQPQTLLTVKYNFQSRPDFSRTIANISYGYFWKGTLLNSYSYFPIELSVIQIEKKDAFAKRLEEINNTLLTNSYSDHFIWAGRFTYAYSNQNLQKARNSIFVRPTVEVAGNLLRAIHSISGAAKDTTGSYRIADIRYAHYIKTNLEIRREVILNRFSKSSRAVYRVFTGLGVPLTNLNVLPFERSYFGGGANGIRAWRARSLGPGGLADTLIAGIDKVGDIQLEANAEYRFQVTKVLEGALFLDVGNIWLLNEDTLRPNGHFEANRFYKEIAIGAGIGARLDFSFFILRLDVAVPMKDPSLPAGERWIYQPKDETNVYRQETNIYREADGLGLLKNYKIQPVFNIGIGYPF